MSEYDDERNDRKYAVVDIEACMNPQIITLKIPMNDYNDMTESQLKECIPDYRVGWTDVDSKFEVIGVTYTDAD